jgi:hypothetical protein
LQDDITPGGTAVRLRVQATVLTRSNYICRGDCHSTPLAPASGKAVDHGTAGEGDLGCLHHHIPGITLP